MPLYEYECPKDGTFEKIQKFSDPPLSVCPTCGGPVERLLSAPAIQFKGTGWYITDYARKGDKGDSGSGKKDGKAGGAASESSKDTSSASSSSDSKTTASSGSSGTDKK